MRVMLSLALLAASAAADADDAVPQDPAKIEAHRRERLEWDRKTLAGAYDRLGKKDPRWDELARHALDLAARRITGQVEPVVTNDMIHEAAKKAVDAGCDDPLVRYFDVLNANPNTPDYPKNIQEASDALKERGYPPVRRAFALMRLAEIKSSKDDLNAEEKEDVQRVLGEVLGLIPKSMAEDPRGEFWDARWYVLVDMVVAFQRRLVGDSKAAFDKVDAKLAKIDGFEAVRLAAKGNFLLRWGWEARGSGFAANVTEEQFRLFDERLDEAREVLERAWELNPVGAVVPNTMLTVERGNGGGDREAMERWFERAMRADGDNFEACASKMEWLDPKWYGDDEGEELVAFGKACAATKNWESQIPLLVLQAHYWRFKHMKPSEWKAYSMRPDVWEDFHAVCAGHLSRFPNDDVMRSRYAMACFTSEHFDLAHEQFQILGDKLQEWKGGPQWKLETMKALREEAAQHVAKPKK